VIGTPEHTILDRSECQAYFSSTFATVLNVASDTIQSELLKLRRYVCGIIFANTKFRLIKSQVNRVTINLGSLIRLSTELIFKFVDSELLCLNSTQVVIIAHDFIERKIIMHCF
jgi:hypothetical protein